jgi:pyruvate dehydrogenase E2 component (dihydrolipoamide acetyltransferase)
MVTPVEMPKLGNTVEECVLNKWRKKKGDRVSVGEIIAEIETDKATFELPAPADGFFLEAFFEEGSLVPVYTNICVLGALGESVERFRPANTAPSAPVQSSAAAVALGAAPAAPPPAPSSFFASPRARKFAREHGLQPPLDPGSGPGGRILEQDLVSLYRASPRVTPLARRKIEGGYEIRREGVGAGRTITARDLREPPVRMSNIRERIARRMRESLTGSAQYTLHTSADATGLLSLRAKIKAARQARDFPDINLNDMVLFATVSALRKMPELNAELIDGKIYRSTEIHLGFACDTDKGLLVPVVRHSERMSLAELSSKVSELTRRAIEGTLGLDDMSGATFTVSNLGMLGIQSFTPILNPPQVAILGVDSIELKPVRRNGEVVFVDHIGLSLTCDHQVIDGAPGARFLEILAGEIAGIDSISGIAALENV